MELKWVSRYQVQISYVISFTVLSAVFGILWAIVLLVTVELLENNFEFDINIDKGRDQLHKQYKEHSALQVRRKYRINKEFEFNSSYISSESTLDEMEEKRQRNFMNGGEGESRPSLMSLIKHGSAGSINKENRMNDRQQPLLAVVKNNLHLRRRSELSHMSKSPLYKNLVPNTVGRNSPFGVYKSHSPMMSPKIHPSSGWYQNSPVQATYQSPTLSPSVSFNRSNVYSQLNQTNDLNTSANGGLEVHGSYFLNKSLLHSNLVEDETFSLVNSKFNSPRLNSSSSRNITRDTTTTEKKSKPSIDETSTEAVVSILKEKSRRKRVLDESSQHDDDDYERNDDSRKRIKFDRLDDTLDNLFPPVQKRKRINSRNVIITKKRLASIGTQYESTLQEKEDTTKPSKSKKSKYGLSEEQTDEMMTDREETPLMQKKSEASKRSREVEELENAVNYVKESVAKYKKENKKVICNGETSPAEESTSQMNESEFQTPIKQNNIIKELKIQSTALKSLKSPYKKIFHTFPSNLAPGSAEKRRKHPVYFTAKIDVDDIQSKREEYGDRGASLKAFRLDQEEAKQRVGSIFDEDEVDFKSTKASTLSTLTAIQTTSTSISSTSLLATSTMLKPAATSAEQKAATSISFNFTPAPSTTIPSIVTSATTLPTVSIGTTSIDPSAAETKKITPKKVSFNIPAAASSTTTSLPSLFPSTTTTAPTISFNLQAASQSSAPLVASTTGGFSLSNTIVAAPPASTPTGSAFSFGPIPPASGTAAPTTTTSSAPSTGFSFPSTNAGGGSKLPSFSEATQGTKPSTGFSFTASVSSEAKPAAATQPQFSFGAKPAASISFGAASSSTAANTAPAPNIFGAPATTSAIQFGVAPTATTASVAATAASTGFSFGAATNTTSVTKPAPTFNFGQTPAAQTTGPSNSTTDVKPAPSFNFGQASSGQSTAPSLFGNPAAPSIQPPTQTATNLFGAPKSQPTSTGFSFGSSAPAATTAAAGFNFGANSKTSTARSVFGAPSTQSVFASAPSTPNVFASAPAASQNVFGKAAPTANVFGSSSAQQNVFNPAASTSATASVFGKPAASTGSGFSFGGASTAIATTTKSGFSFGSSTAATSTGSVFGQQQQASTASVFGQSTAPAPSVFGQPTTTASVFGQQSGGMSSSIFGQPASSASVFGQVANTTTPFGQPSNTGNSVFGQTNASNNVFGAPAASANTNVFGASSSGATSVFGSTGSTAPTPFGNNTSTNNKQASVFGAPSNTAPANPFGQPASNTGFNFNAPAAKPNASFNFGSSGGTANAFGAPSTPAKPSFNFVSNQTGTPSFGTPSAPSFGTPQAPTFGTPQAAPFGAPSPAAGAFTIGAGGQGGAPAGRQTQRARRRMRR